MFQTCRSKGGFTVIGQRPMFEDSEEESLGRDIKAKILEVFGCYPLFAVHETWVIDNEDEDPDGYVEPVTLRDYRAVMDTEKLDQVGYGLSYIQFLLEKVIKQAMTDNQVHTINTSASKKYCFSDTEDWWAGMEVRGPLPSDRRQVELIVELG